MMERRIFIQMISAFGLAPKLPALSINAVTPMMTPVVSYSASQYALGSYYLESRGARTALELGKWLQVNPAQAELLMGDLLKNGVAMPLANGLVRAVNPLTSASDQIDSQVFSGAKNIIKDMISEEPILVSQSDEAIENVEIIEEEICDAAT